MEELHAARGAHRCAQWILMRRRDVHSTGALISANDICNVDALVIHRSRKHSSSGSEKSLARAGIAGLFHPDVILGVQQNLCGELQG